MTTYTHGTSTAATLQRTITDLRAMLAAATNENQTLKQRETARMKRAAARRRSKSETPCRATLAASVYQDRLHKDYAKALTQYIHETPETGTRRLEEAAAEAHAWDKKKRNP